MSWTGPSHILAFHSYLHAFSVVFVPYVELLGPSVGLPGRQPTISEAFTPNSFSPPFSAESFSIESTFSSLTEELNFKAKSTITLLHLGGSEQKQEFKNRSTYKNSCKSKDFLVSQGNWLQTLGPFLVHPQCNKFNRGLKNNLHTFRKE